MGQKILVKVHLTIEKNIFRFELDRSLTGMGYEQYNLDQVDEYSNISKVSASLAVRLLQKFPLNSVDIFSNEVVVQFSSDGNKTNLDAIITDIANEISDFLTFY